MPEKECTAISEGLRSKDPLDFLSKNVIVVADLDDEPKTKTGQAEATVPTVDFRNFDAVEVQNNVEGGPRVYELREANNGDLKAHYLPWNRNTGYYTILDVHSDTPLFFTAMLSGCGVGFLEADDGSAVRFSHHNITRPKTMTAPDEAALTRSLAFTEAKLLPSQYENVKAGRGVAHVHGVLQENRWRFYVQTIAMSQVQKLFEITNVYELKKKT